MSTTSTTSTTSTALQTMLEEGLSAHLGREVRIRRLQYRSLDTRSSHPIGRLQVGLESGEELSVVVKRPRRSRNAEAKGSEREILIYRDLLTEPQSAVKMGGRFGSPALYAYVYDQETGRYWLFLEDVGDWTLDDGDHPEWYAAARWLAALHSSYRGKESYLRSLPYMVEHDAPYFKMLADEARRNLRLAGAQDALSRLERLLASYGTIIEHLVNRPKTLVHGDIFTKNLLIQDGQRIRAVDWESAALGLPEFDLARLLDGWEGEERQHLVEEYLAESARLTGEMAARPDFDYGLAYCRFASELYGLGWSVGDCRNADYVEEQLAAAESVLECLRPYASPR